MTAPVKTPLEMFYHWEAHASDQVFLRQPVNGEWHEYTWAEFGHRVRCLTSFIHSLKLPEKSHISILSSNSADWITVDLAIMLAGHISVPLYPAQDSQSARYILDHCKAQLIFIGGFDNPSSIDDMTGTEIPRVAMLGCSVKCDYELNTVIDQFPASLDSPVPDQDDLFTILYTSGTTGNPKGVMHAHSTPGYVAPRLLHTLKTVQPDQRERLFSFLPLSHTAERVAIEMRALYGNSVISFSEGMETFSSELQQVKPHQFFAVPRLWVKFKEAIDAKFPEEQQARFGENEKALVRAALGLSETKVAVTGAAPIPADIKAWYLKMGIPLCDAYGMTENMVDGCFNTNPEEILNGSVGRPMEGVDVKISDEGEICFSSTGLMKGYYKDPEKTAEVLRDGWYHTGDSGYWADDGCLMVTGRVGDIFKTTKGKFINPTILEEKLSKVTELNQICVYGHGEDQPVLLANLSDATASSSRTVLQKQICDAIEQVNQALPSHSRIKRAIITPDEWTMSEGLLTPTMKIKRKSVVNHFSEKVKQQKEDESLVWL